MSITDLGKLKNKTDYLLAGSELLNEELRNILCSRFITASSITEGIELKKVDVIEIIKHGEKARVLQKSANSDFLQAYGQQKVLQKIEKWAKLKTPITTSYLLKIHKIFLGKIEADAGKYRNSHVQLRGSSLFPTVPFMIPAEMWELDNWLLVKQRRTKKDNLQGIIEIITKTYHAITKIHPFTDGNGRAARLFIALILRRYGLPHITVPKVVNRQEVRQALREADMGDLKPLTRMMAGFLEESLKTVLAYWKKKRRTASASVH